MAAILQFFLRNNFIFHSKSKCRLLFSHKNVYDARTKDVKISLKPSNIANIDGVNGDVLHVNYMIKRFFHSANHRDLINALSFDSTSRFGPNGLIDARPKNMKPCREKKG